MMGATGDTYIQLRIVDTYIREKRISNYVLTGHPNGIDELLSLFPDKKFYEIRDYSAKAIQKAYMLLEKEYLNITIMFPWIYDLYINRCRIRMTEKFDFMDTYQWYVLNLKTKVQLAKPIFLPLSENLEKKYEQLGIKRGRTIILAPEANSVTSLTCEDWIEIITVLKKLGYEVFINAKADKYGCKSIFITYYESEALLSYAGYFIGIRSGLCDIISTIKCKKIIIYPQKSERVNYSEHRSEIDFCGLKTMGLVDKENSDVVEIETRLIRNITDMPLEMMETNKYFGEIDRLKKQIIESL